MIAYNIISYIWYIVPSGTVLVSGSDTGAVQLFTYPLRQGPINFFIINIEGALRRPLTYDEPPIHPIPSIPLLGRYPDTKLLFF